MRAAPIGVLYGDDPDRLISVAVQQSRVTHHDPRCAAGAVAIAGAAALAARGGPIDPGRWLAQLSVWVSPIDREFGQVVEGLARWVGLEPQHAAAEVAAAGLDPAQAGPCRGVSAHVVPSVVWALYSFLSSPDSFWDAVCTAIAVGGDTDTLAAMAGALAGARLGAGALPGALLARLNDRGAWDSSALAELVQAAAIAGSCEAITR
jgi:ADP-ribosylglycohydrolase